jgi:hypothetical protein
MIEGGVILMNRYIDKGKPPSFSLRGWGATPQI